MRMSFNHLVDSVTKQELAIKYVPTGGMWVIGLTKALGGVKHRETHNSIDRSSDGKWCGVLVKGGVFGIGLENQGFGRVLPTL